MISVKKESLKALKDRWIDLFSQNKSLQPYQEYEMTKIICKYYLPFTLAEWEVPAFYSCTEDGKTILIAPMCKRLRGVFKSVNFGKATTIAVKDFIYPDNMPKEKLRECILLIKHKMGGVKLGSLIYRNTHCCIQC